MSQDARARRARVKSMTIWKFDAPIRIKSGASITIDMPDGADILSVQRQDGLPRIWARVDPSAPICPRRFRWFCTGEVGVPASGYVGTVHIGLVFHLFEEAS